MAKGARCALLAALVLCPASQLISQNSAKPNWTPPKTRDGQPDLQGIWNNVTITPLERPREFAGKAFLTEEEAKAYEERVIERRDADPLSPGNITDPTVWWERGVKVVGSRRTSLIVDPPDGRIPPLTAESQQRMKANQAAARLHPADGPQDRSLQERCILANNTGPPMLPGPYNNDIQIVQTRDHVMILLEMVHDLRIIPLDGHPHADQSVRLWMGDSRGHWEGNTLVVDTINFTDKTQFHGADRNLHLIERFTRTDPGTILYQFTVDDPTAFSKQWSGELPMLKTDGPLYEFACHEGNVAMEHMLHNARVLEQKGSNKGSGTSVSDAPDREER